MPTAVAHPPSSPEMKTAFAHWEKTEGRHRPVHRHHAEPPAERPPGRLPQQGAVLLVTLALGRDALGPPATRASASATASSSSRATANPLVYATARRLPRGAADPLRADGRHALPGAQRPTSSRSIPSTCSTCAGTAACPATPRWRAGRSSSSSTPGPPATASPAARRRGGRAQASRARPRSRCSRSRARADTRPARTTSRRTRPGASGLDNLVYVLDWNDHGIDPNPCSSVVHGNPEIWFKSYGWSVGGHGERRATSSRSRQALLQESSSRRTPTRSRGCVWVKTRKGRGYGVYDFKSHGTAHKRNSELFWADRRRSSRTSTASTFDAFGQPDPTRREEARREAARQPRDARSTSCATTRRSSNYLSDRLVEIGDSVPEEIPGSRVNDDREPGEGPGHHRLRQLPEDALRGAGRRRSRTARASRSSARG